MILVADCTASKCDWHLLDANRIGLCEKRTMGLNPMIASEMEIRSLVQELNGSFRLHRISRVEFYCTGGKQAVPQNILLGFFQEYAPDIKVVVEEDLDLAVKCKGGSPAVVCILDGNTKSCFYDGLELHKRLPDFGCPIMDDGSSVYFGRELLRNYVFGVMPESLRRNLEDCYGLDDSEILQEIYHGTNPSGYLANFGWFLIQNQEHPFIKAMIQIGICKVFDHILEPYDKELKALPLHFIGDLAYSLKDSIKVEAYKRGYGTVFFTQSPMEKGDVHHQLNLG
ncbi:hypothetical protein [Flagellimonas abyssi]|uniref:hypothetical protein n=1 Tax=Flagellimonas abyssi TaxID=2864871 RepID=UPI001C66DF7B|nr:hypothetical protein [Allomuricauda abyssi]